MKVCKVRWRRAVGLATVALLLALLCLSADQGRIPFGTERPDKTGVTVVAQAMVLVGDKLRGLYIRQSNPQAGLRSIKVVNEDYVKSLVRLDHNSLSPKVEGESNSDMLSLDEDPDWETYPEDLQDQPNREFQAGDFDYETGQAEKTAEASTVPPRMATYTTDSFGKKIKHFDTPFHSVPRASRPKVTLRTLHNKTIVEDGVFWSERLEALLPLGVSDNEVAEFLDRSRQLRVQSVQPPTWNRCGRPKNQFVVLSDGTQACARYRTPHDYLVQGEVMSFYLARLLGIKNVPTVSLSPVSKWLQWPNILHSLNDAGWVSNATVALIQWVDGLERDKMPGVILNALNTGQALTSLSSQLRNLDDKQLVELVQWSDLILFDYITGNYDRVASMQDAADREQRPAILQETIHNLVKSHQTQSLWLIDNESGLLDSYSLLYGQGSLEPNQKESRFVKFHREMLNTMCIFRRNIFHRVRWLKSMHTQAAKYLVTFITKYEPQFKRLPSVFNNKEFVTNFHRRIVDVYEHIRKCQVL